MMRKYIVAARDEKDIIALLIDTKSVDVAAVKWNWTNIGRSIDDANCSTEAEVVKAVENKEFHLVDEMIMGSDVSVGSMVILVGDDNAGPEWGFVCANGDEWIPRKLRKRESNAVLYNRGMER